MKVLGMMIVCWLGLASQSWAQSFLEFLEDFPTYSLPFAIDSTYLTDPTAAQNFEAESAIDPDKVASYFYPQQDEIVADEWFPIARFDVNPRIILLVVKTVKNTEPDPSTSYYLYSMNREGKKKGVIPFATSTFLQLKGMTGVDSFTHDIVTGKILPNFTISVFSHLALRMEYKFAVEADGTFTLILR